MGKTSIALNFLWIIFWIWVKKLMVYLLVCLFYIVMYLLYILAIVSIVSFVSIQRYLCESSIKCESNLRKGESRKVSSKLFKSSLHSAHAGLEWNDSHFSLIPATNRATVNGLVFNSKYIRLITLFGTETQYIYAPFSFVNKYLFIICGHFQSVLSMG